MIEAALALVREGGWSAVSARTLARRLGTSPMPIYSAFGSMVELERAVREAALGRMAAFQGEKRTGQPLLDMALGTLRFARDEGALYRFLFVDRPPGADTAGDVRGMAKRGVEAALGSSDPLRAALGTDDPDQQDRVAFRMWIFLHGLSSLLHSGAIAPLDDDALESLLLETGGAFHLFEQQRKKGKRS